MAESQLFPAFYIANWNSKGAGCAANRDKVYMYHLKECKEQGRLPDLVFLQELTFGPKKMKKIQQEALREVLYEGVFKENSTPTLHNCVLYNQNKFSLEGSPKELESAYKVIDNMFIFEPQYNLRDNSAKSILEKHMSLATLSVQGHGNVKIIAVSIHNTYKGDTVRTYTMLMTLLRQLNRLTGIPVLLAGDFNMEVGDILTRYPPTKHRERLKLIDSIYLIDPMKKFKLRDVEAHMISEHSLSGYGWGESTCRESAIKRQKKSLSRKSWDALELETMAQRDDVSNHDPLTGTLKLLHSKEKGRYSVFSWNAARANSHQLLLDQELSKEYDFVFLQEIPNQPHLSHSARYDAVSSSGSNHDWQPWVLFNKHKFVLDDKLKKHLHKAFHRLKMKDEYFTLVENTKEKSLHEIMESLQKKFSNSKEVPELMKNIPPDKVCNKLQTLHKICQRISLQDLEPHFALAIVHKKSQQGSIIAVSFHNGNEKQKSIILTLLLYLLEELHDITGYPILLAGDFKMDLSKAPATLELLLPYKPKPYTKRSREQQDLPDSVCVDYIMLRDDSVVSWSLDEVTPWERHVHIEPLRAEDSSQKQTQPALQRTIQQMYSKLNKEFIGQIYPELEEKIIEHIDLEVTKAICGTISHDPLVTNLRQWST
jgi:hypothetical protein